jgi:hypothetical protein
MDAYLEKMDSSLEDIKACRETMEALQWKLEVKT